MASTFIIGRSGNQPFKITADSVSNEHARVTIDNNGVWTLEDLDSPNGTYIRNASGEFNQVYKKIISEDTVIRLGRGGHHGCIFTGHQLISTPGDYSYEFRNLKKALARQQADEAMMQAKSERNGWISKCSGMAAIAICALLGSIDGINIDPVYTNCKCPYNCRAIIQKRQGSHGATTAKKTETDCMPQMRPPLVGIRCRKHDLPIMQSPLNHINT